MIAVIGIRNARTTRTGAIPQSETAPVLHRVWLKKGILRSGVEQGGSLAPRLQGEETRRPSSGGHADADRARHAGAAQSAIARRILGEILLMIVLGEIEFARWRDLGGDGAETLRRQRLLVRSPSTRRRPGAAHRRRCRSPSDTGCRHRCPGACPASGCDFPRTSSAAARRRSSSDRTRPAPLRCDRCGPNRPLHRSDWAYVRRHSRRRSHGCRHRVPRTCALRPRNSPGRTPPARGRRDRAAAACGR